MNRLLAAVATAALITAAPAAQSRMSIEQAAAVLDALPANLPASLRGRIPRALTQAWTTWVEQHDREVRARLARGDEDSLVNFWLYGTSFTKHPPAVARDLSPSALEDLVARRLDDLLDRAAVPGNNERLQFAWQILTSRNADPAAAGGRARARRFLADARQRMMREFAETDRALAAARREGAGTFTAANATIFHDRGLSSDTSILSDYSVHAAVESIARQGTLRPGSVRRVAVIGPGLDFTNKADGYDFYPLQALQPFALIDTLRRSGLAAPDLRLIAFDVSDRVIEHLTAAVDRAATGTGYVVTLPRDTREPWTRELVDYWRTWGRTIGEDASSSPPPAPVTDVDARSVRIAAPVVIAIAPRRLDIVIERLAPDEAQFDLVVATNVLVYYGVFEQALAAANIAAMLRPGGLFISNTAVLPTPPLRPQASYLRVAHTGELYDELFVYTKD